MKLAIGVIHGEQVNAWHYTSLKDLLCQRIKGTLTDDLLPLWDVIDVHSGPGLSIGRGLLVDTFLQRSDADVLLMLDADMKFSAQTIYQMWDLYTKLPEKNGPNARILGGLAFIAMPGFMQPNMWQQHPDEDRLLPVAQYARDTLYEVTATGAACLMIHREVFEKIAADQGRTGLWFTHHINSDGSELGEDLSFCRRATQVGYPIFVHTSLRFGHAKIAVAEESDYLEV